jgi:hypothetical protein
VRRPERMRLSAGDALFELRLVGCQFPGNATDDYDSNRLVVEGSVRHPVVIGGSPTRNATWAGRRSAGEREWGDEVELGV